LVFDDPPGDIDRVAFTASVAFRSGCFTAPRTEEVDGLKRKLNRDALRLLAQGSELAAEMEGDCMSALRLEPEVLTRCFGGFRLWGSYGLKQLDLTDCQVEDLSPLASLSNVTALNLKINSIGDINPLASLVNLELLNLANTELDDLTHLAALVKLRTLDLDDTQVAELYHLSQLTDLQQLHLARTAVDDVTSLAALLSLKWLDLSGTPVVDLTPLTQLPNLRELTLSNRSDRSPLNDLIESERLTILEFRVMFLCLKSQTISF